MGAQRSLITRRRLLELGALIALPAAVGCGKRDQASVLSGLVNEVVLGMARDVRAESRSLHATLRALSADPAQQQQRAAQAAFKRATVAWKRAYAFRTGPFIESEAFQRAVFWPTRATLIDAVLADRAAIDARRVQEQGVDARGLYALEYLLFDESNARAMSLPGDTHGERVRAYAFELSNNVLGYADRIQRLLGDGRSYAQSFSSAGKQSVDTLVSQALDTLTVVLGKFARIERARSEHLPLSFAVEGYYSACSLEIALAMLEGTKRLYLGGGSGGLSELVAFASKSIDDHVRVAFGEAEQQLRAVGMPIEMAFDTQPARFGSAVAAVTDLRHAIDVEMVSALAS